MGPRAYALLSLACLQALQRACNGPQPSATPPAAWATPSHSASPQVGARAAALSCCIAWMALGVCLE